MKHHKMIRKTYNIEKQQYGHINLCTPPRLKGELKDICVLVLKVQLDVNEYIAVGKSL